MDIKDRIWAYYATHKTNMHISAVSMLALVVVGSILTLSHAANFVINKEAESGTKSARITQIADSSASAGQAIKFTAASGGGSCPVSGSNVPGGSDPWGGCFPGAGNTGVPAGTTLTTYTGSTDIYSDNVTIDGKIVTGLLRVGGHNFTLKNSILYGSIMQIDDPGFPNPSFTVMDSTIDSRGDEYANFKSITGGNITVLRSNVSGSSSGGTCDSCTIQDSYFHAEWVPPTSNYHMSAYRMSQFNIFRHNTFSCDFDPAGMNPEVGCSADMTGYGDFEAVINNTIDKNLFVSNPQTGAYYCAYGGSTAGKAYSGQTHDIVFSNNIFQKGSTGVCGTGYAVTDYDSAAPGNQWVNNKWNDGTALSP